MSNRIQNRTGAPNAQAPLNRTGHPAPGARPQATPTKPSGLWRSIKDAVSDVVNGPKRPMNTQARNTTDRYSTAPNSVTSPRYLGKVVEGTTNPTGDRPSDADLVQFLNQLGGPAPKRPS